MGTASPGSSAESRRVRNDAVSLRGSGPAASRQAAMGSCCPAGGGVKAASPSKAAVSSGWGLRVHPLSTAASNWTIALVAQAEPGDRLADWAIVRRAAASPAASRGSVTARGSACPASGTAKMAARSAGMATPKRCRGAREGLSLRLQHRHRVDRCRHCGVQQPVKGAEEAGRPDVDIDAVKGMADCLTGVEAAVDQRRDRDAARDPFAVERGGARSCARSAWRRSSRREKWRLT